MARSRKQVHKNGASATNRTDRDETIAQKYSNRPGPRTLARDGQIDLEASARAERVRASGREHAPFAN